MALSLEGKIVWFAFISRVTVVCLQVIFNLLMPDLNNDVFNPPRSHQQLATSKLGDSLAEAALGGLRRWDGVYFLHIAEYGYTYQNCLAFFPLFPFVVRFLANTLLWPLQSVLSYTHVLQVSALLVNGYCFIMASVMLYRLGRKVLDSDKLAYKSALLFAINPASIFMTAPYSEAMFAYLCFRGLWHFEESKTIRASVRFGAAAAVRSNGLTTFGFIYYEKLKRLILQLYEIKRTKYLDWSSVRMIVFGVLSIDLTLVIIYSVIMFLPFVAWQYFAFSLFCSKHTSGRETIPEHLVTYGKSQNYILQGSELPDWCKSSFPFSYSYIQSTHWGVGLFQYYEFKQAPNFLLALPVVLLSLSIAGCYVRKNPAHCLTLGLTEGMTQPKKSDEPARTYGLFGTNMFVYVAHMIFLVTFGILVMHVQVLTRLMFSSSPLLYWFTAWLTSDPTTDPDTDTTDKVNRYNVMKSVSMRQNVEVVSNLNSKVYNIVTDQLFQWQQCTTLTKLIYLYFLGYAVIGTAAFCNFYPWT